MQWTRRFVLEMGAGGLAWGQSGENLNLSGRWIMNEQASELGSKMRAGGYRETLVFEHQEPTIQIDYIVEFQGQRVRTQYHLVTDGSRVTTKTPLGEEVSTTKWQSGRLVTDSRVSGTNSRTTRFLSADAKRLHVAYGQSASPKWLVFYRDK